MINLTRTALINLTTGGVEKFSTPESIVRKYLGGRGLNMYYLHKYLKPDTEPFSPDNPLIFGTGPLTGTIAPNSSRWSVTAKAAESRALGDANAGGFFGAEMRFAGFERLIMLGKAKKPSYIYIEDGNIEIRDASKQWGLNVNDCQIKFKEELGEDIMTACIGRAGEKLVRFAAIMNDIKSAAGRGGLGAVMGAKNLKAVVVRGTGSIPAEKPKEFFELRIKLHNYLSKSKIVGVLGRVGTPLLYEVSNELGAIRTNNSQLNAFEESLNAEEIDRYIDKMVSCFGCLVHCRHRNKFNGEGPEYSTVGLLGANSGISSPEQVVILNNLCNDLGLDTSSAGTIIPWALELYEKGLIDSKYIDRELKFGDFELMKSLLIDISERKGIGNILAESSQAVKYFGEKANDYLIAIKGLPQSDPHDCRIIKSFGLGLAVASRGADHLRNRPTLDIFDLPSELMEKIYGGKIDQEITHYDTKELMVFFHENIYAVIDSLGLCKFICHGFNSPHFLKYEHFKELLNVSIGLDITEEELIEAGKRVVNLERLINLREGLSRRDDTLPKRYFDDGMPLKGYKGEKIDRDEFDGMLTRYYRLRGWSDDGVPPENIKNELEI